MGKGDGDMTGRRSARPAEQTLAVATQGLATSTGKRVCGVNVMRCARCNEARCAPSRQRDRACRLSCVWPSR